MKLLEGITVLDFCQFLSGPSAAMRLGDLGARVIKIERPGVGDAGRQLTLQNLTAMLSIFRSLTGASRAMRPI